MAGAGGDVADDLLDRPAEPCERVGCGGGIDGRRVAKPLAGDGWRVARDWAISGVPGQCAHRAIAAEWSNFSEHGSPVLGRRAKWRRCHSLRAKWERGRGMA